MILWSIHKICSRWWQEVFSDILWSDIIRILSCISISIRNMGKKSIISRLYIIPPIISIFMCQRTFCMEYSLYWSPSCWKIIFKSQIVPTFIDIIWKIDCEIHTIEFSFLEYSIFDWRRDKKFAITINSARLINKLKGTTHIYPACTV